MSRCKSCDDVLQDHELGNRGLFTGEYTFLCDECTDDVEDALNSGQVVELEFEEPVEPTGEHIHGAARESEFFDD